MTDAVALGDADAEALAEGDGLADPDEVADPDALGEAVGSSASPSVHPESAKQAAAASATAYDVVEPDRIGTLPLMSARPRATRADPSTN